MEDVEDNVEQMMQQNEKYTSAAVNAVRALCCV